MLFKFKISNILGVDLGDAFDIPKNMQNKAFFPAVCMKNAEIRFNFGEKAFQFPPKVCLIVLIKY